MTVTTVATTAPLVTLTHDWGSPVERSRIYPTTILPHRGGTEQRVARSSLATERLTYRWIAPDSERASILHTLAHLAEDRLVRVGRWEDQTRVTSSVTAGDSTVPCDTTDRPTFELGAQVMLWRDPFTYEVAVIDALSSASLDTVDPLTLSWGPGTIVTVVEPVRLVEPYDLTHWRPTSGALSITVERLVNDVAGVGSGGTAVTGTPDAITLEPGLISSLGLLQTARGWVRATVTDAAGTPLLGAMSGGVWASTDPTNLVVTPTADPDVVVVTNGRTSSSGGSSFNATVSATIGAVSGSLILPLRW